MYLHIKGFRSIQQYECNFQPENITLISGQSGIGKTTIMNSIFWCLYGTLKNVRKFGTKSGPCKVSMELGQEESLSCMKITRSKSPESLLFEETTIDGFHIEWKDVEAQEKINQLFGSSDIWLSSCYLRQGTRNKFLESSPSERLLLLSELCFSSDPPDVYLEKIDEKCKSVNKDFDKENEFYKRNLEHFQSKRKEYPTYKDDLLSSEQKTLYQSKIHSTHLTELEEQLSHSERAKSTYLSLSETKSQLESRLPSPDYKKYLGTEEDKMKWKSRLNHIRSPEPEIESEIRQLECAKTLWLNYLEQFEQKKNQMIDYTIHLLNSEKVSQLKQWMTSLPREIQIHEEKWRIVEKQKSKQENLKRQVEEIEKELSFIRLPSIIEPFIEENRNKIDRTRKRLDDKKMMDKLLSQQNDYVDIFSLDVEPRKISNEEINLSRWNETKVLERRQLLDTMSIDDKKESVEKAIELRKRLCQVQPLLDIVDELYHLETMIESYQEKLNPKKKINLKMNKSKITPTWFTEEEIPMKILELESLRDSLTCPNCSTVLKFESNRLVPCHDVHSPEVLKDKIEHLSICIEESKKRLEWTLEKGKLEGKMDTMVEHFKTECEKMNITQEQLYQYVRLDESDKQKLYQEMKELEKTIPSYDLIFESSERLNQMNRKWEWQEIQNKIEQLETQWKDEPWDDLDSLEREREQLVSEKSRGMHLLQMIERVNENIRLCESEMENCLTLEEMDEMKKRLDDSRDRISKHERAKEISELYDKICEMESMKIDEKINEKKKEWEQWKKDMEMERKEWEDSKERLQWNEDAEMIRDIDEKLSRMIFEEPIDLKNKICSFRNDVEECRMKIYKSEKAEELAMERARLETQRNHVIDLSNQVSHISTLKMIANELEHKRMISILDTINDFSNEILTILFDEPIKIEFMVYKTAKTKDKVKPSIVYKILYRGYEMDHVEQLSGGEGDRISLAVTCALFQFSKFPFLLLDEFASSLDLNTKEMAIKSLKTFLGIGQESNVSKGILCISHDTVEGIYDDMIKL